MSKRSRVLVAVALVASTSPAAAQTTSRNAAAEQLFAEGRARLDAGDYAAACPKLAESQRLDPAAGTLLNLADCYAKNGQTASAWTTFREAASAAADRRRADWERLATKRANALEPKLSRVVVVASNASVTPGLTVTLGSLPVTSALYDTPIPVDPGRILVTATAEGRRTWTTTIEVGPNAERKTVTIPVLDVDPASVPPPPGRTAAPSSPPPPPPPPPRWKIPTVSWALGAGALVASGVGVGLWAAGLHERGILEDTCGRTTACSHDSITASRTKLIVGDVLVGGATVLLATGVTVALLARPTHRVQLRLSPHHVTAAVAF